MLSVPLDEAAHIVAESAVPFLPAVANEASHLIEAGRIPCLRNQFGAGEDGIRLDIPEHRGSFERAARFVSVENRGEVEAEPIDMHLSDPVSQAVENQAAHDRVVGVQRVPGAAVIGVLRAVLVEDVVHIVGEAAEAEGRSRRISLGGVVVDDVEDHLDTGAVQRLDEIAEFVDRPRADPCANCSRHEERRTRPANIPSNWPDPPDSPAGRTGISAAVPRP